MAKSPRIPVAAVIAAAVPTALEGAATLAAVPGTLVPGARVAKPLSAAQVSRKLVTLAQRAYRAQAREDFDRLDTLGEALDELLAPLLTASTPRPLHEVMTEFFKACTAQPDGDGPADLVSDALQDLSEGVSNPDGSQPHRLFALSVLVPVGPRDWAERLTDLELAKTTQALRDTGMLAPDASVTWLPTPVPFSSVLDLSEWSVAQVAQHLAEGQIQQAGALVSSLSSVAKDIPADAEGTRVMEARLLMGLAGPAEGELFPLGAKVLEKLETADDDRAAMDAVESTQSELAVLADLLMAAWGVAEMQVTSEIQGWWADVEAAHQLMRTVHAQQHLQGILRRNGLFAQEVLASSNVRAVADEPVGMAVSLYRKEDLVFVDTLRFVAMPSELPQDCAEEALDFMQSNGVAVVDGKLLVSNTPDWAAEMDEAGPRLLH